jgi:hypothetical protein
LEKVTLTSNESIVRNSFNIIQILRDRGVIVYINDPDQSDQPVKPAVFVDSPIVTPIEKDEECLICQENLNENFPVIVSNEDKKMEQPLKCGHKFHKACIEKWMNGKRTPTCPLCRSEISTYYPIQNSNSTGGRKRKTRTKNYKKKPISNSKTKTKKNKKVYSKKNKSNSKKPTKRRQTRKSRK